MKVVRFRVDDYEAVGLLEEERVIDFTRAYALYCVARDTPRQLAVHSILHMLQAGLFTVDTFSRVREFVQQHGLSHDLTVQDPTLLAPIHRPPRIIALGRNYAAHAAESGHQPPKEPIFFVKASTAVIGPDDPVGIPRGVGRIDHEVEVAVVIGKPGRRITRRRAAEHIAGYTILNDVTAREMQSRDMAAANPWFRSKSFDTFAPMGPCITLPDEIQEPCELDLSLAVNGETRQQSNTRHLVFDIPELIHRLSRYLTIEPGDVISTGTPEGISSLQPGDVMEARVERIGVLRSPVVAGR
jgi:5-oxopent-3-ene-1,2,5-tricarboxylate decarboxylase/2-hydroxyhepta-2,4-diene-1,7-dioate isomerase